ncbi:hypothetical protein N9W06_03915 [Candidatus Marinimicrobia bacterium]|nr:hypothetical protein [Candidatus Neomarinimicrobiota bacterium]
MSFLTTLKKVENIILGKKSNDNKSKDHWKKYRRPKIKSKT